MWHIKSVDSPPVSGSFPRARSVKGEGGMRLPSFVAVAFGAVVGRDLSLSAPPTRRR